VEVLCPFASLTLLKNTTLGSRDSRDWDFDPCEPFLVISEQRIAEGPPLIRIIQRKAREPVGRPFLRSAHALRELEVKRDALSVDEYGSSVDELLASAVIGFVTAKGA